jgi:hypothetical protein
LCASHFWFFLTQCCERQQNLRERPKVVAVFGGSLELLDAFFLVAADSSEPKKEPFRSRQTPNYVIRRAQAKVGVRRVRGDLQQFLRVGIRFADLFRPSS